MCLLNSKRPIYQWWAMLNLWVFIARIKAAEIMSKRCELQKEYFKEFGNYKGNGKYSDDYVKWLEDKALKQGQSLPIIMLEILFLRIGNVLTNRKL